MTLLNEVPVRFITLSRHSCAQDKSTKFMRSVCTSEAELSWPAIIIMKDSYFYSVASYSSSFLAFPYCVPSILLSSLFFLCLSNITSTAHLREMHNTSFLNKL